VYSQSVTAAHTIVSYWLTHAQNCTRWTAHSRATVYLRRMGLGLRSHWYEYEYESRVRVSVYGSCKLRPVTCTRTTQRVFTDNLQLNQIERMLCKNVNSYSCITCVNVNGHHWNANSCLLETVYMYPDSYSYQCQRSLKLPSLNVRVDGDWEVQFSCYFVSPLPLPLI